VVEEGYLRCSEDFESWAAHLSATQVNTADVERARLLVSESDVVSIGSSLGTEKGFCDQIIKGKTVCTDRKELDLFKFSSWQSLFGGSFENPPIVLLAEHVLEHFSPTQVQHLAASAFLFMKPGGVFRVAVPDGYKPSPSYQQYIRAGSTPSGMGNQHIVAYTYDSLTPIFRSLGYKIHDREHYDASGRFHSSIHAYADDEKYGKVMRSWKHDTRNAGGVLLPWKSTLGLGTLQDDLEEGEPLYTSLWFDAIKPMNCSFLQR